MSQIIVWFLCSISIAIKREFSQFFFCSNESHMWINAGGGKRAESQVTRIMWMKWMGRNQPDWINLSYYIIMVVCSLNWQVFNKNKHSSVSKCIEFKNTAAIGNDILGINQTIYFYTIAIIFDHLNSNDSTRWGSFCLLTRSLNISISIAIRVDQMEHFAFFFHSLHLFYCLR